MAGQHVAGADVPMYVWLYNRSGSEHRLLDVTTPAATDVALSGGRFPATVPPDGTLFLRPGQNHRTLRGITEPLRGGEFTDVTFHSRPAGDVTLRVQVQPPPYDTGPWTPVPAPAPRPTT